jgi:hypothetical protein
MKTCTIVELTDERLESKELRKTWQERLTQELEAASFAVNKAKDDSNEVTNV